MACAALAAAWQGQIMAGSSPTLSVSMVPNVTVTGDAGTYTLQYASVLGVQTNWVTLTTNLTLTGTTTNWLDYSGVGQAQRFYRTVALTNSVSTNPNPGLLVWIPAGTFVMGSPATEAERNSDEAQHTVVISKGFYMAKHPVTQAEYHAVTGVNPSWFSGNPNNPVEQVSWNDATNYCALLTQQEQAAGRLPAGWAYRLPTESEWEYSCRAGTTMAFYFGNAIREEQANFNSHCEYNSTVGTITTNTAGVGYIGQTTPVGTYGANPWGLTDICGNVWEWCSDWYGTYPTGSVTDPVGFTSGSARVMRGGSWRNYGGGCRSAVRGSYTPDTRFSIVGFRPVLAPGQP